MCDNIEEGLEWVYAIKKTRWVFLPTRHVYVDKMIATQRMVTISGMDDMYQLYKTGEPAREPILLIERPDGRFLIRDGHHRYVHAFIRDIPTQPALVIPMPGYLKGTS